MNITYTHKFQSRSAAFAGAVQNIEHMIYTFWWDNTPNHIRERQDVQQLALAQIRSSNVNNFSTILEISNIATRLVEDTVKQHA